MKDNVVFNMTLKCKGCNSNTSVINMKKIGTKRYCPICYSNIISALNTGSSVIFDKDEKGSQNQDDEGSKRFYIKIINLYKIICIYEQYNLYI